MDDILIRRLVPEDREKIIEFYGTLSPESTGFFNVNHGNEQRTLDHLDGKKPDHIFYAAQAPDGRIAGLAFIWTADSAVPWFGICVHDNFQRMGIGSALLSFIQKKVEDSDGGGILLRTAQSNIKAQGLYEKYGFERMGVHPSGEFLYIYRISKGRKLYD